MNGADVVTAARGWTGVRWRHQGRSRDGIDCAGLVIKVAHDLGLSEFDTKDYARQATDETMLALCREHAIEIAMKDARPGDLVVLRFGNQRHIGFLGDYLHGGLTLLHAYSHHPRKVVEHRFDETWLRAVNAQLIGVFRLHGVVA